MDFVTFRPFSSLLLACSFGIAAIAAHAQAPAPLPPATTAPLHYECFKATAPIVIDGKGDDAAWAKAPWTSDFVDIQGDARPKPRFRTRVKMLWDDKYLYVLAQLQEPDVLAKITQHDAVIFKDNDFEIFIKPLPATESYYEFEINALNAEWDLFLNKPYRENGKPDNSWEIPGLKTAVSIQGTLNNEKDRDQGWTVEIAYPWKSFDSRQPVPQPHDGSMWRINFSRVEWTKGNPTEDNWVWSPQGVINMHVPDRWGYLEFRGANGPSASK